MSRSNYRLAMRNERLEMNAEFDRCRRLVDDSLDSFFKGEFRYKVLLESMRYSLLAGGKRIRAIMCLKFCEAAGGDILKALDAACAIEMLHAYSLIHDDLPCMDDDDMRRGLPSNHIKFGEFTATLAGDALQAAAFETLLGADLPSGAIVQAGLILTEAAGAHGICGGQYLDINNEGKLLSPDELEEVNRMKTATLISASAVIGVVAAGGSPVQVKAAEEYANAVGLAFQLRDDVLDYTSTAQELGKPINSDEKSRKKTFAALLGTQECERMIRIETEKAIKALNGKFDNADFLIWLANMLAGRKS